MRASFNLAYIESLFWSEMDSDGTPFDDVKYADAELAPQALAKIEADCDAFVLRLENLLIEPNETIAHDFVLTRNRHGAGFWDGDYEEPLATQLTNLAHEFGEQNLYQGDDGLLYV